MDKFSFIRLWDTYRGLLTPVQREITDMYFNLDLTLSEIAEEKGITRQGVSECLKTCKKQLEEYEEKLRFCGRLDEICLRESFMLTGISKWAEDFLSAHPEYAENLKPLSDIIRKDYSGEVQATLKHPELAELLKKDYTKEVFGSPKTGEE